MKKYIFENGKIIEEPDLLKWAKDQFGKVTCFNCEHEKSGNCTLGKIEKANGIVGYSNVEYFIMCEDSPDNCPLKKTNKKI